MVDRHAADLEGRLPLLLIFNIHVILLGGSGRFRPLRSSVGTPAEDGGVSPIRRNDSGHRSSIF